MIVAKTEAAGDRGLLPEVLAFTSSLPLDRQLLREDLAGSLAHLTMLARCGIVPRQAAVAIRAELVKLWDADPAQLPAEEDVHMAVEARLTSALGETAGMLHTARSRNDQVALDLRLHVREQAKRALDELARLLAALAARATAEVDTIVPAYTHRQRAQPVSLAYALAGYGAMFARDAVALRDVLVAVDEMPLGVGAIAGTSLPIDRETTRKLLRFSRLTENGLDTVGDRDFALDFAYATARTLVHASRVATDMIDFCSAEFGFATLDGNVACGSSMMPQKRNPDVFELIRGKSGRAVGNLTALFVTVKGLPGGYNRDLQEDRQPLLETGPMLQSVLALLRTGLEHVRFDPERTLRAVESDYTQATDVAEALAQKGVPFRTAYQLVGKLVRRCQEERLPLSRVTLTLAREIDPRFDEDVLRAADPRASVARKRNAGGTGPQQVKEQIAALEQHAARAAEAAKATPHLNDLFAQLREADL
ncbi:MAG TPA: argininosuccinate lyase [Myxococcales bacterium]|nr:argininosuccinate lyase [Myxococcales bacterium]